MFERFTDEARRVLVLAQDEARLLEHGFIGTEHLLLGILHHGKGPAPEALTALGVTLEAARAQVAQIVGPGGTAVAGSVPFTPRAKKTLELALREALQFGHDHIGTEHLLLGILDEGEGVGTETLVALDVDLSRLRDEVTSRVARPTATSSRVWRAARRVRAQPSGTPPLCPSCRAPLEDTARYRVLDVCTTEPDEQGAAPISVTIAYCQRCGVALGPV